MKQEIISTIKFFLEKTISNIKSIDVLENTTVSKNGNNTTIWFHVEVEDSRHFIRNEGEPIFAINYLAKRLIDKMANTEGLLKEQDTVLDVLVDINGFQKKRIDNIKAIAHMMAERARYFKSSIEFDPMSSFERKIIHEFLAEEKDLRTESQGVGKNRKVVLKYLG